MDWLNYTLFTFNGDTPVLLIDLITSIAGLTCVFLAGRNSKYNFWVGYVYSVLLFLMFWNKALWANMLLQPISLGINILGHYRWTHPKPEEVSEKDGRSLKVSMLSWPQRAVSVAAIFALGWLWGWLLETLTHDPVPYLDACVTALILVAQFLSALKKWDCWVAWLAVNITQIILHISVGHVFMPIVCALYLINGAASIINWWRLYREKA